MNPKICPLCLKMAEYRIVGNNHDMYIHCANCYRSFVVSDRAYEILLGYTQEAKDNNLRKFDQIQEGDVWHFCVSSNTREEGIAFPSVVAKQVNKKSLLN